jgi:hypothetical protein
MKNKFLLMAVISALGALLVLPSALGVTTSQDTDVEVNIDSGDFTLTAHGNMAVPVNYGMQAIPNEDLVLSVTREVEFANHYFQFKDYQSGAGDEGGEILIKLTGDFEAAGSIQDIPANKLQVYMHSDATPQTNCPFDIDADGDARCAVLKSLSSPLITTSTFTIGAGMDTDGYWTGNTTEQSLISTELAAPYVLRFNLEKFKLTVPANQPQGVYSSTLYLLASQPFNP